MNERSRLDTALRLAIDLTHRTARDRQRRYRVEGLREFIQAADAGTVFDLVLHCPLLNPSAAAHTIIDRLRRKHAVPTVRVTPEQFRRVSTMDRAAGVLGIARQEWTRPDEIEPAAGLCWLVCESIRSPGNLGTILRTAEAVGAAGLWCIGERVDPFDPTCVRATMGGLARLRFVRTPIDVLRDWALQRKAIVLGLDAHAGQRWTECEPGDNTLLMIGDERKGLSDDARQLCTQLVTLPQCGRADSLNVSVATGVMLYELFRRQLPVPAPG